MRAILASLSVLLAACGSAPPRKPFTFTVMTFNTGTNDGMPHNDGPDDGYGSEQATISNDHYGNGLAWKPVIADAKKFLAEVQPDIAGFQELFHSDLCPEVPEEARKGFVCEDWKTGDPTVVQTITGAGYQVACHLGKPDKCLAVKKSFGSFRGCASDFCLEGLAGARVPDCGGGSRVGRGTIDLAKGGTLTVVNVHGSSGANQQDQDCRVAQFDQVFVNLDGQPAANGGSNVVLGDFNTDPFRLSWDESALRLQQHTMPNSNYRFITAVGEDAPPTYALFNIDHVITNSFTGSCWHPGITEGHPPVTAARYFDHKPAVCTLMEVIR